MKQASLFDGYASLAGAIPAIKAAMREAAKAPGCDGRKALPDMMNELAVLAGVCYNFCVYFAAEPQLRGQNPALYENVSRLVQFWL